jgi:surface protein
MFWEAESFDMDLSKWDVSRATDMSKMFAGTKSFNGDISNWRTSRVRDMSLMFAYSTLFDGDISRFDMSSVTTTSGMFRYASSFKGDLSRWRMSRVRDMSLMFSYATLFDGDISNWEVSSLNSMSGMFMYSTSFNGDISKWDVSSVNDMQSMFYATSFHGDISRWHTSRVTDMSLMFSYATLFDGDISSWDVSQVTSMASMFSYAMSFNGDISNWDVSKVMDVHSMFNGAKSFKQNLCGRAWVQTKFTNRDAMFTDSPGSIARSVCAKVNRRPLPNGRELIRHKDNKDKGRNGQKIVTKAMVDEKTCQKCGTFEKSGRASCCAPGGAWYKKCGGAGNKKVAYQWSEGVQACAKKATTTTESIGTKSCAKCGSIKKSGKMSCCGRGGSWFRDCGSGGNSKFGHTWSEGIQACVVTAESSKTGIDQKEAKEEPNASTGADVVNPEEIKPATKLPSASVTSSPSTILLAVMTAIWLFIRKNATSQ